MPETTDVALAARIVDYLNELHALDADAVSAMIGTRVPCNAAFADHPSCQVTEDCRVGLLGLLNGLCGHFRDGSGPIAAVCEGAGEAGRITGFFVRKDVD